MGCARGAVATGPQRVILYLWTHTHDPHHCGRVRDDQVGTELAAHLRHSEFQADDDLVFPHPELGVLLDRSGCASGSSGRSRRPGFATFAFTISVLRSPAHGGSGRADAAPTWLGHRDFATTLRYADYMPSEQENELVERTFARDINGDIKGEDKSDHLGPRATPGTGSVDHDRRPVGNCGPGGRRLESGHSPLTKPLLTRGFCVFGRTPTRTTTGCCPLFGVRRGASRPRHSGLDDLWRHLRDPAADHRQDARP
jgi:hypothetical protein